MKKYLWLLLLPALIAAVVATLWFELPHRPGAHRGTIAKQVHATAPPSVSLPTWTRAVERDAVTGRSKTVWTLFGTYLVPPSDPHLLPPIFAGGHMILDSPAIVLVCHGSRLIKSFVDSGAVVLSQDADGNVAAEYRLDNGPVWRPEWAISTDYRAAFFDAATAARMLRARAVLVGLPEFEAGEIEIRFGIPASAAVRDSCGLRLSQLRRRAAERRRRAAQKARRAEIEALEVTCGPAVGRKLAAAASPAQFDALDNRYSDNCGRQ
ncbi:MAG: hypothetical protein ACRD2F_04080 [Terriglobales bacterium]